VQFGARKRYIVSVNPIMDWFDFFRHKKAAEFY
jgi:hypothetical protein